MMWAALFPGQGSQAVGMGKFLYDNFAETRLLFEEASDTLSQDLKRLCFDGPETDLALTENTQPALLLVSTCAERSLKNRTGVKFHAAAGHSIGEYAALVAVGSMEFAEAIRAVRVRGQAMQSAVPVGQGAMLAVLGLEDAQVEELCTWAMSESGLVGTLEPANFNSPGQVVVSGHKTLADWLVENAKNAPLNPVPRRMKLIPLNVSAPFHCSLMKSAEEKMRLVLEAAEFKNATLPVVQNVGAEPVQEAAQLRENLIRQVTAPVQWVRCIKTLGAMGVRQCVELGSGKVLQGLVKKIDSDGLNTFNMQSLEDFNNLEREIKNSQTI